MLHDRDTKSCASFEATLATAGINAYSIAAASELESLCGTLGSIESFSKEIDKMVEALGVKALQMPVRAPKANGFYERLVGLLAENARIF